MKLKEQKSRKPNTEAVLEPNIEPVVAAHHGAPSWSPPLLAIEPAKPTQCHCCSVAIMDVSLAVAASSPALTRSGVANSEEERERETENLALEIE